ncbi:glyoxysomal fatty acid beta-oxidation multifunctional protein MFP-a-like [Syzygium oleosum]|uniref:glyoxysomal fatty acid beta-oxidation multifunctional protein MFP-a-like n=1 Tax=Syzygium oleosum TaxID=219896 RepID=UPI0024BA0F04|nr:glyoxysomal fatty acid beta-oxidation multifunctional protein MFP-a-like [Syzygium oleosum]
MTREAKRTTVLEVGDDGVALITIVNPPVNALTANIFRSLSESYEQALVREDVKAIVATGAKGIFCGGFDVSGFCGQRRREGILLACLFRILLVDSGLHYHVLFFV